MDIFGLLNMACGLAFFLYGMHVMGEGLSSASGGKLESVLEKLTHNQFKAVLLGAAVTAVMQSSSATTVMVVGFVNSGIMHLTQAASVIMGANVGTTITSWILSLTDIESTNLLLQMCKPSSFAPIMALVGVGFLMFSKSEKKNNIGTMLMGFSILMTGMDMMSNAVKPLADVPEFTKLLLAFNNPILGLLAGTVFTGIIQSSAASIGILQALCVTGAIKYSAAVPIIMGQNIGTCITAILSAVGANKNARRAALIHLYIKIIGAALFMAAFYAIHAVFPFAFMAQPANAAGIAVIHSTFNILTTIVLMPFTNAIVKLTMLTIPDNDDVEKIDDFQLLDERFLATPAFAVEQCSVVADRMAELTREAIFTAIDLVQSGEMNSTKAERVEELESKLDRYEDKLGTYLVKLSRAKLSREDGHTISVLLHSISDFERISDHAVNLLDSVREMDSKKMKFSSAAEAELNVFSNAIRDIVDRAFDSFMTHDVTLAKTVEPLESCINEINVNVKSRHIDRLTSGKCTIELGFVLADISTNFERVSDHCSNLAVYQIQVPKDKYETHAYLQKMKFKDHAEFDRRELAYEEKYRLPDVAQPVEGDVQK